MPQHACITQRSFGRCRWCPRLGRWRTTKSAITRWSSTQRSSSVSTCSAGCLRYVLSASASCSAPAAQVLFTESHQLLAEFYTFRENALPPRRAQANSSLAVNLEPTSIHRAPPAAVKFLLLLHVMMLSPPVDSAS